MRDAGKISARLRQLLPQCIVVIQPEAGHVLLDTQAQVLPFLRRQPAQSTASFPNGYRGPMVDCCHCGDEGGTPVRFVLTQHASDHVDRRQVKLAWIEYVLDYPARVEQDRLDPDLTHHLAPIPEFDNRILRVVVNHHVSPSLVITFFFDRRMRGKL